MKKILLFALCLYLNVRVLAQTTPQTLTVKGVTIDSATNKPLDYVTTALQDAATLKSVKGTLTKPDGSFVLTAVTGKPRSAGSGFEGR